MLQAITEATEDDIRDAPDLATRSATHPPRLLQPSLVTPLQRFAAVYTALDLQRAFHVGVRDIKPRRHLDLRSVRPELSPVTGRDSGEYQIGWVGETTRSIQMQGNCSDPPPLSLSVDGLGLLIAEEEPWQAPRCLLVSGERLFSMDRPGLWLDSLHIQLMDLDNSEPWLWWRSLVFNELEGRKGSHEALLMSWSTASFYSSTSRNLGMYTNPDSLDIGDTFSGSINASGGNDTMVMQNCSLQVMPSKWPIDVATGPAFFSDDPLHLVS
eukprot:jgi/Ulvmu1/7265/UM035_0053.1